MNRISYLSIIILFLTSTMFPIIIPDISDGSDDLKPSRSTWGPQDISPSYKYDERNSGQSPYNLSTNPGDLVWKFDTGSYVRGQIFMDKNETSLVANSEKLFVIDRNGVEMMNISSGDNISFWGMPLKDGDGNFYLGSMNYTKSDPEYPWYVNSSFYSFYPNGSLRWEIRDGGVVGINPVIYQSRLFFTTSNGTFYCAHLNGTIDWTYSYNQSSYHVESPAFDSQGNIYFVGSYDYTKGFIISMAKNGSSRWHYDMDGPSNSISIGSDDLIYVNNNYQLFSFYPNGSLNWNISLILSTWDSVVQCNDGSLLVTNGYTIYSLFKNGTINWTKSIDKGFYSDLVRSNDGYIVYITIDSVLKVLTPDLQEFFTFNPSEYSHIAPVIGPNGDIYFSGDDGIFYKIGKAVPSPPRNLTGRYGDEFVQLNWEEPRDHGGVGIDEYRIFRGEEGVGGEPLYATVEGDITTYNDTNVVNGREYSYMVKAVNIINISIPSNYVLGIPIGFADPPVVKRVWSYQGEINFEWDPPFNWGGTEILSYCLFRSLNNITFDRTDVIPRTFVSYSDLDVVSEQRYYYYFKTKNAKGDGPSSPVIEIVHHGPPSTPGNFRGTGGDGFIDLFWDPPSYDGGSQITSYTIMKESNFNGSGWIGISGQATSYHDKNVTNGLVHYYILRAVNDYGVSGITKEIKVTPMDKPLPPENLTIERFGNNAILNWNLPTEKEGTSIINLQLYRKVQASSFEMVALLDPTSTTYTMTGIINGTSYEFYLTSLTQTSESGPSNIVTLEARNFSVNVDLLSLVFENETIVLEWEPLDLENLDLPDGPDPGFEFLYYTVYRIDQAQQVNTYYDVNASVQHDLNFTYGTSYTYFVTVSYMLYNTLAESPPSDQLSITPATLPDPPTLFYKDAHDSSAEMQWTPPTYTGGAPITGYRIVRTSQSQGMGVSDVSFQLTYLMDGNLLNGETYTYSIFSINHVGSSTTALIFDITPMGLPTPPMNLSYTIENGNVTLKWDKPENDGGTEILGYVIFMGSSPNSTVLHSTLDGVGLEFTETIGVGDVRYYKVAASNNVGMGDCTGLMKVDNSEIGEEEVDKNDPGSGSLWIILLVLIIIVSIVALLWMIMRKKKDTEEE